MHACLQRTEINLLSSGYCYTPYTLSVDCKLVSFSGGHFANLVNGDRDVNKPTKN